MHGKIGATMQIRAPFEGNVSADLPQLRVTRIEQARDGQFKIARRDEGFVFDRLIFSIPLAEHQIASHELAIGHFRQTERIQHG